MLRSSHWTSVDLQVGLHSGEWSAKLSVVSAPFGRQSERSKESLSCPTPGPKIYKMLLVLGAHHGWSVRFFDVSRAFLHTPIKTCVFAVPLEEHQSPIPGGVWQMTETVYGLEEGTG